MREREERFLVRDFGGFRKRVRALGYAESKGWVFTDEYYSPAGTRWDPRRKSLRLRLYGKTAKIIFCERRRGSADKTVLFEGRTSDARRLLKMLGLTKRFEIAKLEAVVFAKRGASFAVERVRGLGWTGEAELHKRGAGALNDLRALGVKTTTEPLAWLFLRGLTR